MKSKRFLSLVLALTLIMGIFIPAAKPAGAAVEDDSCFNFDTEGLWMTEIYTNDAYRNAATCTRVENGYHSISLFDTNGDLMEFVELLSTHEQDINLNDYYEIYFNDKKLTITTCDGSSTVMVKNGQPIVLWNHRSDLNITLPTEEQFRRDMDVNPEALVIRGDIGNGWASNGTFTVKSKLSGRILCTFSIVNDTHAVDGLSVSLKVPMMNSNELEVYRAMNLPSPGYINEDQVNGMLRSKTDSSTGVGVFITEIRPNDVNRKDPYGLDDDFMECWEITNTTDMAVDLNKDYQLAYTIKETYSKPLPIYNYSSTAENHQGSDEGCTVPAGGCAVIWNFRQTHLTGYKKFPTVSEFRAAYNIPDDVPVYISTKQSSMYNYDRGLELYSLNADGSRKALVSSFFYHAEDCADDTSAILQINPDGPEMLLQTASGTTHMGTVDPAQLAYTYDNGEFVELHLLEGVTVPASIPQGEDLRLRFYAEHNADMPRLEAVMYYRFNGTGQWLAVEDGGLRLPNIFDPVLTADKLFDQDYVEVYVVASNPHRSSVCGIFRIDIEKLNAVDGIRTNISDGEPVRGTVAITANDGTDNANTKIYVDGFKQTTMKMLEDGGYFSFYCPERDTMFKNLLTTTGNEPIKNISRWLYENLPGQVVRIDSSYFTYNSSNASYDVTLRFWSGTYGAAISDTLKPDANRDNYTVSQLQMKLPNGKHYLPTKIGPSSYNGVDTSGKTNLSTAYDAVHSVGDSKNWCPYMDVSFSIPAADAPAVGVKVDTTKLTDGVHTLKVTNGTDSKTVKFVVDNTAPEVELGISSGSTLTGSIVLDPKITDANNLDAVDAMLDGKTITLPYSTTAFALGQGSHTLSVCARDTAGNETVKTVTFHVADVSMTLGNAAADSITSHSAKLSVTVSSGSSAETTFYQAQPVESSAISAATTEGLVPYITYTVRVGQISADQILMVSWKGAASNMDAAHVPTMYARNIYTGAWDKVGVADENGFIENATFSVADYVQEGEATLIIQCMESNLPDTDTATNGVKGNNGWDGTDKPEDYDFAFAWISDTQGYAQRYPNSFTHMNQWIVDHREDWKISYVMHTGDIVDDWDTLSQWENAHKAMQIFDDAAMPYGVLGGNHDIAMALDQRDRYYEYFGQWRVEDQPTFGGSYENNYGHYDLISQNGQDFIIVYMSWNMYEDEINWMNDVLARYANRKAILCFHSYTNVKTSVDGLLDYWGVLIRDYVVSKNPNVIAVLNGHYHGATYQTAMFDDDGDGITERTVYQICTDYQAAPKGGMQYIKFLYFDVDGDRIYVNSYSPQYNDFNYFDGTGVDDLAALAKANNGMASNTDIDSLVLRVDFDSTKHTISADSLDVYVGETQAWGTARNDASGKAELTVSNLTAETDYAWYAAVTNAESGKLEYKLGTFTTAAPSVETPDLTGSGFTLSFEDEILVNFYFTAQNCDADEYGMLVFYTKPAAADFALADDVYAAVYVESSGRYMSQTAGIAAKQMGDTRYYCAYAKCSDGTYAYSPVYEYSPKKYATNMIGRDTTAAELKALCVAMLNYGAAAQEYFGYKTDDLMNGGLSDAHKALVADYDASFFTGAVAADPGKVGAFAQTDGFGGKSASVSFEGAFAINYYFMPNSTVAGDMKLYIWNPEDYAAATALTAGNASGVVTMEKQSSGFYWGQVSGIAAKALDDTYYVAGVYTDESGNTCCTGVIAYALSTYCMNNAKPGKDMQLLAANTAMYGYYAKAYFSNL